RASTFLWTFAGAYNRPMRSHDGASNNLVHRSASAIKPRTTRVRPKMRMSGKVLAACTVFGLVTGCGQQQTAATAASSADYEKTLRMQRSEERRVGEECRSRWSPDSFTNNET